MRWCSIQRNGFQQWHKRSGPLFRKKLFGVLPIKEAAERGRGKVAERQAAATTTHDECDRRVKLLCLHGVIQSPDDRKDARMKSPH